MYRLFNVKIGLQTSCRAVGSGLELQRWQFFRQLADAGLDKIGYNKDVGKKEGLEGCDPEKHPLRHLVSWRVGGIRPRYKR